MKRRIEVAVAFIGEDLICHLAKALARARALHPGFAASAQLGAGVIMDEAEELWDAVTVDESQERQNEEATDVVVTGLRFLNGEYTEEGRRGLEQIFIFDDEGGGDGQGA